MPVHRMDRCMMDKGHVVCLETSTWTWGLCQKEVRKKIPGLSPPSVHRSKVEELWLAARQVVSVGSKCGIAATATGAWQNTWTRTTRRNACIRETMVKIRVVIKQ